MNIKRKVLLFFLLIFILYSLFSLVAYADYRKVYQDCERTEETPGVIMQPDPKFVCEWNNARLLWKIKFPFGIPPFPRSSPL